jgi:hypothetical protein
VTPGPESYVLPEKVDTGARHDEIARFVGALWNRNLSKQAIAVEVREKLVPLFVDLMDDHRLAEEIEHAYETAARKWKDPAAGDRITSPVEGTTDPTTPTTSATTREIVEVGLLDFDAPVVPVPMHADARTTSVQIAMLLNHFDPRTDAGLEGLTVTSLVYLGALMGHQPSTFYGSREQHTNIMAMLVGASGKARKGTTVDLVRSALAQCTDGVRGLKQSANSGEGLIALAAKADGAPILIEEEEFDRFLASKGREGSTLSSILRQAFDDIPLTSATAAKVVRADTHHIAMLGNVTDDEIRTSMARVDLKNGFANRILWTGVFPRDVKVSVHDNALDTATRDSIRDAIKWAQTLHRPLVGGVTHQMDAAARDLLAVAAERYNAGVGLAPFLSRRLDTIAARIALIYACLDQSRLIEPLHVEAALAVTDYAWLSAQWVFPETTGDARADYVLRHLRVAGFLNYTELEALIGKRSIDRQQVFDLLGIMGYARQSTRPRRDGRKGAPQKGIELA